MSKITTLSTGAITAVDTLTIELVQTDELRPSSSSDGRPSRLSFTRADFPPARRLPLASSRVPSSHWRSFETSADCDRGESAQPVPLRFYGEAR